MMSISDILQLVVLCALLFFPLGFLTCRYAPRIALYFRILFVKPRHVKPEGTLHRVSVKADHRHD